ncbi:transcriptional regulator [Opitutaceae bacterium TAV1]|nr:transcriptional regulator [Opitutaceae bacterium TAV1]
MQPAADSFSRVENVQVSPDPKPVSSLPTSGTGTSKLDSIYSELQSRIVSGVWKIGERLPTEPELAQELGCGTGTISKAMARLTRDNLVQRRSRAGTVVINNTVANRLAPVGAPDLDAYSFIYPGDQHESIWRITRGFQQAAAEAGRRVMLLGSGPDFRKEAEIVSRLSEFNVRGAVLYPVILTPHDQIHYLQAILASRLPVVLLCNLPGSRCSSIVSDGLHAGFATANHLIRQGARRIGFLANYAWTIGVRDHYLGYRQALELAGLAEDKSCTRLIQRMNPRMDDPLREPTEIARDYLVQTRGKIDAVVCGADFLGIGLLRAAREQGLHVPGDLRIISTADNTTGSTDEIPLTAYRIPLEQQGRRAFDVLDATLNGRLEDVVEEQIRGEIVVRTSA